MNCFIPNTFSSQGKKFYVAGNNPEADDNNPGTKEKPFKTITKAASVMGKYDEIVIATGVYREEIPLYVNGHQYSPEIIPVFRAKENNRVYIKGSDVFTPKWERTEKGFIAPLPSELFEKNTYNPFAEGTGRVFVDGKEIFQEDKWDISPEGDEIILKENPAGHEIEITTRKRCFKPEFEGTVFMELRGIRVEHAAEPGPFCIAGGLKYSENAKSGINVKRTFNMPGTSTKQCRIFTGETGYLSKDDSTLKATVYDDTVTGEDIIVYDVESKNHAMTWKRVSENRVNNECFSKDLFLDEETNFLIKTEMEFLPGSNPSDGGGGDNIGKYQAVPEISLDGGATWRSRRELGLNLMPFKIHKLQSGDYILPCAKTRGNGKGFHQDIEIFKGVFDKNSQELNWQKLSNISVTPDESACGLAEPHLTSFENGRLIVLLRMGAIIPSQHRAGVPSVKFYSVSDDNGLTWSKPAPLKFDDGKMIYSPRSYQDILRSSKNGRVYAIFNVCDQPTTGCDPRNKLQIMEIDPETCRVKRESLTVIEEKHPECHHLIRYSNWIIFESRATRNPVLLMRPHMSELCPVRQGYDLNSYRYEIELPEN